MWLNFVCSHACHQGICNTFGLKSLTGCLSVWGALKTATHGWESLVQSVLFCCFLFLCASPLLAPGALAWTVDWLIILFDAEFFALLAELLKQAIALVNKLYW